MQTAGAVLGTILLCFAAFAVSRSFGALHPATANALPAALSSARATAALAAQDGLPVGTTWSETTSAGVTINYTVTAVSPLTTTVVATMPVLHVTDTFIESANA